MPTRYASDRRNDSMMCKEISLSPETPQVRSSRTKKREKENGRRDYASLSLLSSPSAETDDACLVVIGVVVQSAYGMRMVVMIVVTDHDQLWLCLTGGHAMKFSKNGKEFGGWPIVFLLELNFHQPVEERCHGCWRIETSQRSFEVC